MLDLSKIEAGKMELDLEETHLAELLSEIISAARPAAVKNGNEVICRLAPNLGTALCDAGKFRNMAGQLLDNAMKFTHNGTVEVVAERQVDELGDDLVVRVIDTGIGIAPAQIANLFEKFTVADDSSTSKYGGTGLGLALSQRLCKLMGGEIAVRKRGRQGQLLHDPYAAGRRAAKGDAFGGGDVGPGDLRFYPAIGCGSCQCLKSCWLRTMRSIGIC